MAGGLWSSRFWFGTYAMGRIIAWMVKRAARVLLLVVVLMACRPAPQPTTEKLAVGVVAPLTGAYEPLGRQVTEGVILATELWNQRGGVLGRQVELVLKDGQCDYVGGRSAAQAAIDEGADFIIGAVCADASRGVAHLVSEAGVLQISPASADPALTLGPEGEVWPLVFRVPFIDPDQGVVAAEFALAQLAARRAGVLYAEGSRYGQSLAEAFQATFEAGGGVVVARKTYDQDLEFFFDTLEEIRAVNPDVLYMPGYHNVANRLVPQARSFGLLQPILGSDGWDSPALDLEAVGGVYFTAHTYQDDPRPIAQSWMQRYEARYQTPPSPLATLSYDAANLLFTAIAETGEADPIWVAETLETLEFEGVSGPLTFDALHNPIKPVLLLRLEEGQVVLVGRLTAVDTES